MSRPNYRVILSFDSERKTFTARVPELPHCTAEGMTRAEAILHVEEELAALYANLAAQGKSPPAAIDEQAQSGEFTVKVSRGLHRELMWQAASDGVELSHLAGELLSSALESRRHARPRRAQEGNQASHEPYRQPRHDGGGGGDRRRGGPQGGRYPDMDDRAHFIEYVRTLENNDGRRGGGGPRGERHGDGRRGGGGGGGGGGPRGGHGRGRDRRPGGEAPAHSGDQGAPSGNSERGS